HHTSVTFSLHDALPILDNPYYPERFDEDTYNEVIDSLLRVLSVYGIVEATDLPQGYKGYRLESSLLEWRLGPGSANDKTTNPFLDRKSTRLNSSHVKIS